MVENFLTGTAKKIEPFSFLIPYIVYKNITKSLISISVYLIIPRPYQCKHMNHQGQE